jgi:small-conductance mechanosensitive channel/CRP-like cAMP-binding protein
MPNRMWNAIMNGADTALIAAVLVAGLLLAFGLRATVASTERPRLSAPIVLLLIAATVWLPFGLAFPKLPVHSALRVVPGLLVLLAFGRLATVALFDWALSRRLQREAPRIMRDIAEGVIGLVALLVILRSAGVEAVPLLTTSALLTAIVGLSLQDTLGNLLAGVVLQFQRPFDLGEWIQIDRDGLQIGRVIELNWRATKVLTGDHQELNIPNSQLARSPILNLSRPSRIARRTVELLIPYEFPTQQVRSVLERVTHGVPGVLDHPKPQLITQAFVDQGIRYRVQYFIDDFSQRDLLDSQVRDRLWYALNRARIPFGRGAGVAFGLAQADLEARNLEIRTRAIRNVDFLRDLPDSAVAILAADARTELYAPGELVVRQGERGEELYLCVSGELLVLYTPESGEQVEVARLAAGGMFGEFAQLTGEVRAASVQSVAACELVAIGKTAFSAVLGSNPSFAELISQRLAERRAELDAARKDLAPEARASIDEHKGNFLRRLRELLSL